METSNSMERPRSTPFEPYGKVQSFEIILDRRDGPNGIGVYSPGDLLTGHVRLELSQRLTVSNLDLLVQGTGNAAWRLRTLQGDELVAEDEVYLNEIAELVGKRNNEMVTLSAGEHVFPFACDLPVDLPATFTGSYGNVSYVVKVVVQADRNEPAHREPCITTNIFLVESRLSLEGLGSHLNSYRIDQKHPIKSSALSTGPSSIKVSLFMPRRAYDIGDNIVVNVGLTNSSRKTVKNMSIALVMEAEYQVRNRKNKERLLVVDQEDNCVVQPHRNRQWRHVGLPVPRFIPPSGLPNSSIMSIRYLIVFKAEIERSQESVMLETQVLIGMQLPDEMKLDTIDQSIAGGELTAGDSASRTGGSSAQAAPQILYQGRQEPQVDYRAPSPAAGPPSQQKRSVQQPLYIDVAQQKPSSSPAQLQPPVPQNFYQPVTGPQQQPPTPQQKHNRPQGSPDSQVITMRFADELEDQGSPYGPVQQRPTLQRDEDFEPNEYNQVYQRQQEEQQLLQHHPHAANVTKNPLYEPDDDGAGPSGSGGGSSDGNRNGFHDGAHERQLMGRGGSGSGGQDDRMISALNANLDNGAEELFY